MSTTYKRHRFPIEIISYGVWLYYTFALSICGIQTMMLFRGIIVTLKAFESGVFKITQSHVN